MRIALLADAASIHTQRWVWALANAGVTAEVWSERPWPKSSNAAPVHAIPPGVRGRLNVLRVARVLHRQLNAFHPDVVHAHYVSRYGLYAALLPHRPRVMSVWGADVEVFPHGMGGMNRYLLQYILSRADAITTSSRYLKFVTARYARHTSIDVIPFGIDRTVFSPRNAGSGSLRWIINKALEPVYGIDVVLEAWSQVPREYRWEGRLLGEGSDRPRLMQLVKQRGLTDRVSFLGRVAPDQLPEVLAWADVGLYPSHRESFGVAPLEMQALGRAVIAHQIGGLPEVINAGVTGILMPINEVNAWRKVFMDAVTNPEKIRQMGQKGPQWVAQHYDFTQNLQAMLALYHSQIAR